MKIFYTLAAVSFATAAIFIGSCTSHEGIREINGAYEVDTDKGTVTVQPLTDDIFRVTARPAGTNPEYTPSQSAILEPQETGIKTKVSSDAFSISSPTTTVRVDRKTGQVSFLDNKGNVILSETGGVDNSGGIKSVTFNGKDPGELYGAGERGHSLSLNGDSLVMYNRQNYGYTSGDPRISQMGITAPYFASDKGYGVLFDDYNEALLVLGDTIKYTSETPKPLSYYFINGGSDLAGTTEGYTLLTGRQDLPPFWSLGYITSKYGYHNQKEALGAIDSLKTRGYPVDGMVLDLYWYGVETDMGKLEWDKAQWPDHKKMIDSLKSQGVNLVLISQPYINKKGAIGNYTVLADRKMLTLDSAGNNHDVTTWVGDAGMFDVSNPATREWLWNRLKGLTSDGIAGWWGDLGEPEVHPRTIMHSNGETASQYHNVYCNEWSRLIYEGLRKDFPEMRPLLMMRGGTAGLQRYSVFPWTTDVSRSWGGLQPQVNLMLNSGLSGLGYMSSDLGGFAVDRKHPIDEELYVRWVQMGAFTPVMRTHATQKPEPYHYPGSEEILKNYVKMRYQWLPYNYTLAYENSAYGKPLARPLNFNGENPGERYSSLTDEYLWGDEVLIAPVMEQGARERKVLFPAGEWISYHHPSETYKGGTEATVKAPLEELPMFVRAGSFIPLYEGELENVSGYDPRSVVIRYYPSENKTGYTMFDDNRLSPTSLADGAYQLTYLTGESSGDAVTVSLKSNGGKYEGMPEVRMMTFEIINADKPGSVKMADGTVIDEEMSVKAIRQYGWAYDEATRSLFVRFPWNYEATGFTVSR
ncbi:MAG: DUF4968 domain-containing protein [Muribaculaceae bacterium]|nr:DUF4968 domain-containing protein [Muribaculaceae bacterium]